MKSAKKFGYQKKALIIIRFITTFVEPKQIP